jgi:hypothetical protein
MKGKLLEALKNAIGSSNTLSEAKKRSADDLLKDIKGDDIQEAVLIDEDESIPHIEPASIPEDDVSFTETEEAKTGNMEAPPTATPLNEPCAHSQALHSIPHNKSPIENNSHLDGVPPIDFVTAEDLEPIEEDPPSSFGSPDHAIVVSNPNWKEI